ncbi:uncharacterized protein LOC115431636 [Sphaeramia orbicularis]|uniref:uncharacterized protein LOC115431636 n=1 Tax=Sphaeramia orbicularis TaxID=375764 RepID=UPI00117CF00D|nr:uncharacterized protein LOC115431636 [Sphaeramia orbicularis]
MTRGYRLQFLSAPPVTSVPAFTIVADHQYREILRSEVSSLLAKRAIREVGHEDRRMGFYSRYFLTPKRDGTLRPILDLRGLNKFLRPLKCKMLSIPRVKQAVLVGDWFATVDLKDAYFQIPIWEGHRRFLRFAFDGKIFEFCVLPFGISLAPRTFTRCMDATLGPLRRQGLRILNYLDDWLICAQTEEQCHCHVQMLLMHIQYLGLRINDKKCNLQPSQAIQFLGMWLDTRTGLVALTPARQDSLRECLELFYLGARVTWKLCLRLLGLMAAAVQVVPLALLHMRPVQRCLYGLGLCPQRHRRASVLVTGRLCTALRLGCCPRRRAIHLALVHFLPVLQGCHVLVRTDSTTAAAYINRQGGTGSLRLSRIAHRLWTWAYKQFLSLRAMHVPGVVNVAADLLSRRGPHPGNWRLHPAVVEEIWHHFGRAVADLFASKENAHCPLYYSIERDSPPLGCDAMVHQWPQGLLYAFPPFSLLPNLLQRISQEEVQVVLVAPDWPHMTWFSWVTPLLHGTPWKLPVRRDLLSQAQGTLFHPFPQGLDLWAWPLRGPAY